MSNQITFELVSPVKKLLGKPVAMVTVPGSEGDFGVLPGHAPLIATLRPGIIEVYESEQTVSDRIFVAGGFAEVTAERCTVLAQDATPVAELSRAALDEQIAKLNKDMAIAESDAEREQISAALTLAQAKFEAAPAH